LKLSRRDAQYSGRGWGCRKQAASLALKEIFDTQGPTLSDVCRD